MRIIGPGLLLVLTCVARAGTSGQPASPPDWRPRDVRYPGPISLAVDATDVERGIFRVEEIVPVTNAGSLTLLFPKWVPGNHAPTARIEGLAGLTISADGRRVAWTRDPVDMYAFRVEVPRRTRQLKIVFQYLTPTSAEQGRVVATPALLNLQWFSLTAYPAGYYARGITVQPTVRLPPGWRFTTQLEVARRSADVTAFKPVNLEVLLDSPIFAGAHFRSFDLGRVGNAPAFLDVVADAPGYLEPAPGVIQDHARLVRQAGLVFGTPPFRSYRFMLALTDEMGGIGTEHLGSSENTRPVDYLANWRGGALLPHELAHSWNGKARRPADLWSADFNQPMRNSMLWLYEGQTQFWGFVLAARSGLMTREQVLDVFARLAALQQNQPGRAWRPLADTGNDAIVTRYLVEEPWPSWHRSLGDSYFEADLMWLEADGIIRALSGGRRSLDDFARTFFAGGGERPSLYTLRDVIAGLDRLQPYDWTAFLDERLHRVTPHAPSNWLARSGYRLAFADVPTRAFAEHQARTNRVDLRHSIGLVLRSGESGAVNEVMWGGAAFAAGITPGATILTVNGKGFAAERLEAAIQANRAGKSPIQLAIMNRGRERIVVLDYRGGLRYPRLERVAGTVDRLGALLAPRER